MVNQYIPLMLPDINDYIEMCCDGKLLRLKRIRSGRFRQYYGIWKINTRFLSNGSCNNDDAWYSLSNLYSHHWLQRIKFYKTRYEYENIQGLLANIGRLRCKNFLYDSCFNSIWNGKSYIYGQSMWHSLRISTRICSSVSRHLFLWNCFMLLFNI